MISGIFLKLTETADIFCKGNFKQSTAIMINQFYDEMINQIIRKIYDSCKELNFLLKEMDLKICFLDFPF
jgi:aspartate/glutamate racemase